MLPMLSHWKLRYVKHLTFPCSLNCVRTSWESGIIHQGTTIFANIQLLGRVNMIWKIQIHTRKLFPIQINELKGSQKLEEEELGSQRQDGVKRGKKKILKMEMASGEASTMSRSIVYLYLWLPRLSLHEDSSFKDSVPPECEGHMLISLPPTLAHWSILEWRVKDLERQWWDESKSVSD